MDQATGIAASSETARGLAHRGAFLLLLSLGFVLPLVFLTRKSVTIDEVAHIPAGYSYLRTGEVVLNPMHPPLVKELAAIPLLFLDPPMPADAATIRRLNEEDLTYQREFGARFLAGPNRDVLVFAARVPAVLLSVGLAALVFVWARQLWGPSGGLVALFLYVFDPTVTAHAQLVTTDVGFAFFAALFVFLLRRYARAPSFRSLLPAGVALGLALGAKFSAVALPPIALGLLALVVLNAPPRERASRWRGFGVGFLALCIIAAATLWAIYLFPPDPTFYAHGLGTVRGDKDLRYLYYLGGDFRTDGWPHYLLVAWLLKTPIPALLAVLLAAWLLMRRHRAGWVDEAFLIAPALVLFVGYSLGSDPGGIRYLIPCYPFLYVFTGRVGPWLVSIGRTGAVLSATLALWYLFEFITIAPDHLSYFNQIAGGPQGGLAWLDDSNVDWGQGLIQLRDHLREHPVEEYGFCFHGDLDPGYYGIGGRLIWTDLLSPPEPGVLILSGHCVARARAWLAREHGDGPGNWLANLQPKAVVGHVYYVYEVPG